MERTIPVLKVGDKVRYAAKYSDEERGIVKSIGENKKTVFVVYNCNEEWSRYSEFTGVGTNIEDLKIGW